MKFKAIIFDLFGTLVDSYSIAEFNTMLEDMARILSVKKIEFIRFWVKVAKESMLGNVTDTEESVRWICQHMDINPPGIAIKKAAKVRFNFEKRIMMHPRPDALELLKILKKKRYKIGLISDCTIEAPLIWRKTPLAPYIDFPVFSSIAKIKKPNPLIYQMVLEKLQCTSASVVYVGDGSSRELSGALNVGMYPVKIEHPKNAESSLYAVMLENWDGRVINSFLDLPAILEESQP